MPRRLSRYWNLHSGRTLAARHRQLERLARAQEAPPVPPQDDDVERCLEAMSKWRTCCRECGQPSDYLYCDACAKDATCPHGEPIGECDACDIAGDLAFDAKREG